MSLLKRVNRLLDNWHMASKEVVFFLNCDWEIFKKAHEDYEKQNKVFVFLNYDR
jgi:hypothetical protein